MTQPISPETVVDDDEPFAEPVPDADADEDAEHEEAAEEGAQEPEAASGTAGDDPKAVKALNKKITDEGIRHAKRLGDILGEAATKYLPCPLCFHGVMGFVLPEDAGKLPEEQKAAALSFVGEAIPDTFKPAVGVVMCDRCDGFGQLAYPTRNPHVQNQTCPKCTGNGYVNEPQAPSNVSPIVTSSAPTYTPPPNEVGPCPLCLTPNAAGKPHYCNPVAATGGASV